MAGAEIEMPANGSSDWSSFVTQVERQRKGFCQISIDSDTGGTEYITAGSVIEVNGSLYQFSTDEEITGSGNQVHFTVAGSAITSTRTTTLPTWDDAKQGFYDGNERYAIGGNRSFDIGMIADFATKDRYGWLECDGSTVSSTDSEYAWIIAVLKNEAGATTSHAYYHADANKAVLPDARGYVKRGITGSVEAARDKDGDRESGSHQADGNDPHVHTINHGHGLSGTGSHTHVVPGRTTVTSGANSASINTGAKTDDITSESATHTHTVDNHNGNSGNEGSGEGTVKNMAVYIMIKY